MRALAVLAVALGAAAGTVQSLPLSWVAGERIQGADPDAAALGTIWSGTIAHIDGLPPIGTRLEGTQVRLAANGDTLELDGVASTNSLSDVRLALPIRTLSRFDPRLAGLAGTLDIEIENLRWTESGCTEAAGTARTDVLAVNGALWSWTGPRLQGPVTCRDGQVVVALSGRDAGGVVDADVAISPAGPYRTTITIDTSQPGADVLLPVFGFERVGAQWRLSESGSWM